MRLSANWKDYLTAGVLFTLVIGIGGALTSCNQQAIPSSNGSGGNNNSNVGGAGTSLSVGDVAFVGYASRNANVQDQFAAAILKPISAGTTIIFTTANALADGSGFQSTESSLIWVSGQSFPAGAVFQIFDASPAPATVYANGTATSQTANIINNGFSLSKNGDNIFAIQGSLTSPAFIAGIVSGGNGNTLGWGGTDDNGRVEYLPPSLTAGTSANSLGGWSTGYYGCTTSTGTEAALDAAINNVNHWAGLADTSNTDLPSNDVLSCTLVVQ